MERNTKTTLDKLFFGDRCYKFGDTKKAVLKVVERKVNRLDELEYITIRPTAAIVTGNNFCLQDKRINKPKDFVVIFLRHETAAV